MDVYQLVSAFYSDWKGEKKIIGKSILYRNIYAVKIGDGKPVGLAQYALHAREYITSYLALAHAKIGVQQGSLWLIPLANPDGALLSQVGIDSVVAQTQKKRLLALNGGEKFSLWKANARGVDLNVNFDAEWGKGTLNVRTPGAENYIGQYPFSEPETQALKNFTMVIRPDYTVSYHTKGEEIYWWFHQSQPALCRDAYLAQILSNATGYPLKEAKGSVGGYKDWCIQALKIPAFTIEAGQDAFTHPLGIAALKDILQKNEYALYALSKGMIK